MKIRIKTYNGELPSYLTVGRVYLLNTTNDLDSGDIIADDGQRIFILIDWCFHLNGGSWEVVE